MFDCPAVDHKVITVRFSETVDAETIGRRIYHLHKPRLKNGHLTLGNDAFEDRLLDALTKSFA